MKFRLDKRGWLFAGHGVKHMSSPNHDKRKSKTISLIVLHSISLPPGQFSGNAVLQLFTNQLDCNAHPFYQNLENLKVSAHFFVRRQGSLIQCVSCFDRAWHAGQSQWQGMSDCNDFSLGIELEGTDKNGFTSLQYRVLKKLLVLLSSRYPITAVVGHEHVSPGRKKDPGVGFRWHKLKPTLNASIILPDH